MEVTETAHPSILVLEQTFDCTADKIWDFWTVPDLMQLWFGSDPNGTVSAASADLKVDGSFTVTFVNSNGTEHTCSGRYLTIEPFSTLSFTWYWKGREKHQWGQVLPRAPLFGPFFIKFSGLFPQIHRS
jgi:uncharacterized protein YndB with AHSA1/START domain